MKATSLLPILLLISPIHAQLPDRWAFNPGSDKFSEDALLDLRYLNENQAGESGFVSVDPNGDFVLGNGLPVRFWAVNTDVGRERPFVARPLGRATEPSLERHARFLAKRGVNMVRLSAYLNPDIRTKPDAAITDINEAERDWIWRTVAAMKKEGIYVTISPYFSNTMQISPTWEFPGGAQQPSYALLFFDDTMKSAYKEWLRKLLTVNNPYTDIPLARDPAVAILQIQNEDSLLFFTVDRVQGPMRRELGTKFYFWLVGKYGTWEAVNERWRGTQLAGDDPANGFVDFYLIWETYQNRTGGQAARLSDQVQFWAETMYGFHRDVTTFVKEELHAGFLVNATNWKTADAVHLEDLERWTYTGADVLAVNRYYSGIHDGRYQDWAIVNGDEFTSPSILFNPREFPLNVKQVPGYPFLITESAWVMPMAYATEAPFLVAAYQSLTGVDAFYWFTTRDDEWSPPQSANGYLPSQEKWTFGTPDMLGMFPAAALLFRKGYVRQGQPVVHEERAWEDLWARKTPVIAESASYDPNRDLGNIAEQSGVPTAVSPDAFLMGPVEVVPGGNPGASTALEIAAQVKEGDRSISSVTGEIELNTEKGYCKLNATRAQGVAAHFRLESEFELSDVSVKSGNSYGAVLVVSMDDKPLRESGRILVQYGTRSRPSGWLEEAREIQLSNGDAVSGFRVVDFGHAPWMVDRAKLELEIRNPAITSATILDVNGYPQGTVDLTRSEAGVQFRFPDDALYVVLR